VSQPGRAPLDDDGYCFACGQDNPHGLQMAVEFEDEQKAAACHIALKQRFQGWATMAHGGVVSTLLDEVMAHAVLRYAGQGVTALQENRYREPVPLGRELEVKGWVARQRGRLVETEATVCLAGDGRTLAEATAKFFLLNKPPNDSETEAG